MQIPQRLSITHYARHKQWDTYIHITWYKKEQKKLGIHESWIPIKHLSNFMKKSQMNCITWYFGCYCTRHLGVTRRWLGPYVISFLRLTFWQTKYCCHISDVHDNKRDTLLNKNSPNGRQLHTSSQPLRVLTEYESLWRVVAHTYSTYANCTHE